MAKKIEVSIHIVSIKDFEHTLRVQIAAETFVAGQEPLFDALAERGPSLNQRPAFGPLQHVEDDIPVMAPITVMQRVLEEIEDLSRIRVLAMLNTVETCSPNIHVVLIYVTPSNANGYGGIDEVGTIQKPLHTLHGQRLGRLLQIVEQLAWMPSVSFAAERSRRACARVRLRLAGGRM